MTRFEYKYLLPDGELPRLREALSPVTDADGYVPPDRGEYTVRSIYFDTPALDYYYQKLAGIQRRADGSVVRP